ncbi:alpha/beta fold hydrolase [Cyclobacterium qasimii]|uniref:Alpha/beta hydrolase fold protein n=2 Tax=Cyclobacterium qasimii TaxID=1350429 RepID=S7VFP5_9BACT|nr:alpha/beta hydrolase [Cyclobacterium qasimii]EPR69045.1 alpha/beta hydrolase fold protein [Cyclobacterium qasimii M12-11B]GEO20035.1 2-succinyl-6-hydroxy-2,4-cyclohexadiene-1-carboxy late synthase [Cyclobacterium qasimii]
MAKVKVNNVEIHYDELGKGKEVLLFSHGYLMNNTMFNGQMDKFKANFRCIAFDHRGHGQSEIATNGYSLDNLTTDVICLIEELKLGSVHFVGMSTGGFVGMRLAIRRPELLKSLILMDTSAEEEEKNAKKKNYLLLWIVNHFGWYPVIGKAMSILFHKSFLLDKSNQLEVKKWRKILMSQNIKALIPFGKMIFERDSVLGKLVDIKVPTAVIVGEKDVATPPASNKRIADSIPNADYFTIPDAGHSAVIEKPEEVFKAMREFYAKNGIV